MNKVISLFLDRIAERFVALTVGLVSSRIEGFHAASQAEQLSDLEDLARRYEAAGKTEIAASLRQRVLGLTSSNPAAEAEHIVRNVTEEPLQLPGPQDAGQMADVQCLPGCDPNASPRIAKRPRTRDAKKSTDATGDLL
jgi:hypothetical protein